MNRLFDPTRRHFAAWVWLYDIDCYWTERMPTMHPMQPEAVPLYYASLCGFVGLAEHLIATYSLDVNSKGGFHTTPLHAASVKGHLQVVSLLLRNGADPDSRDHLDRAPLHRVSQGGQLVMAKLSLEITQLLVNSGASVNVIDDDGCARYTRQRGLGIVRLRNCYLDLVQVSMLGIMNNRHRWRSPVLMGSLTWHTFL
jgi:hypothetical protein